MLTAQAIYLAHSSTQGQPSITSFEGKVCCSTVGFNCHCDTCWNELHCKLLRLLCKSSSYPPNKWPLVLGAPPQRQLVGLQTCDLNMQLQMDLLLQQRERNRDAFLHHFTVPFAAANHTAMPAADRSRLSEVVRFRSRTP